MGKGSWTRRAGLPAHVIAAQQRRGQQVAARQGKRRGDLVPVRGKGTAGISPRKR